ncbi:unnamed protein product [Prorocentrum cordatum]|uniref:J domain-containing protein n=1 Tax=Prorocentrum cordatum TaxID=2364126 RepID=A0ABN9Y704_9DINO|nr:unnamed protein product [Polarella glacialis]
MAVTVFDGAFSFQQDSLARLGDRANAKEEGVFDATAFKASPFMMKMGRIDQATDRKMSVRDKARVETDPTFLPSEADFSAPKSFKYDKTMNYYRTLGIDEYATQEEVKKAFKKLSLTYHPDKTHSLPKDVREEYAHIFIEIKNASATLSDNATRRQYDRDRDRDQAAAEIEGWKIRERTQFDAAAVSEQKADRQKERTQKAQSQMVEHRVECRLEKFIHGGQKAAHLSILLKDGLVFLPVSSGRIGPTESTCPKGPRKVSCQSSSRRVATTRTGARTPSCSRSPPRSTSCSPARATTCTCASRWSQPVM